MLKIFHKKFYSLHPGKRKLSPAIILAFLIFLPFTPSSGKVFWSRLAAKSASIFGPAGNWTQIYKCPMTINGSRAFLSVYGCDDPFQSVMAKLRQKLNENNKKNDTNNQVSRLLMLAMPDSDKSVVFEIARQTGDFHRKCCLWPITSRGKQADGNNQKRGNRSDAGNTVDRFTAGDGMERTVGIFIL